MVERQLLEGQLARAGQQLVPGGGAGDPNLLRMEVRDHHRGAQAGQGGPDGGHLIGPLDRARSVPIPIHREQDRGLDLAEAVDHAPHAEFGRARGPDRAQAGRRQQRDQLSVPRLGLVAIPTRQLQAPGLSGYDGPILFATGSNDSVSSLEAVQTVASARGENAVVLAAQGADHFWWGQEEQLAEAVRDFFAPLVPVTAS